MKFVALLALSLALTHAIDVPEALQPQTLLQESQAAGECDKCAYGSLQSDACSRTAKTTCRCALGHAGSSGDFTVGTGICKPCSGNQFQDEESQASCKACGENTLRASPSGTRCECKPGFFGAGNSTSGCEACPTGYFQDMSGQMFCFECDDCLEGQTEVRNGGGTSNTVCQCASGFAGYNGPFAVGTQGCRRCGPNQFQDQPGQGSCKACPQHSTRSPANINDGTHCFCNKGYAGSGDANGCTICSTGTYQDESGKTECKDCYTCGDGEKEASACTNSVDRTCVCQAGFAGSQGSCTPCTSGKYQDQDGQGSCKSCKACAANTEEEVESCDGIKAGQCRCSAGAAGVAGNFAPGSNGNNGCKACDSGKFQPQPGQAVCSNCKQCNSGSEVEDGACSATSDRTCQCAPGYSGTAGSCQACQGNTYQDEAGQSSCKNCPANSARVDGDDGTECSCNAGYTPNNDGCSACSAGKFKSDAGDEDCQGCASGSTSSAGASECEAEAGFTKNGDSFAECAANTYKSAVGNTACTPCGDNSSSGTGSTSINDCVCNQGYEGSAGSCTEKRRFVSGSITQFSLTAKTITFSDISDPIVFVSPLTYNGPDAAVTRVVAGNNQYSVEIEEPDCLDQRHPVEETCDWLVIEKGDTAYGGSTISVFTANAAVKTDQTITFPTGGAFGSAAPTCFAYIQSKNNDYYLAPRIKSTSATQITVRIEPDERKQKDGGASYQDEMLGFICFQGGVSSLTGQFGNFGIGSTNTAAGTMNKDFSLNVGSGLTKAFSQMTTLSGGNPTIVRHKSLSNGVLTFRLQEDKCKDNDDYHVVEKVTAFGFQ